MRQLCGKYEVTVGQCTGDADQYDCAMFRDGDHSVATVLIDLKIIDALNSAKPFKRKLIFTLMEIQDDIVAECPVRGVGASTTEAEGVVAASTAKAIVSSLDKLDHQLGIAV